MTTERYFDLKKAVIDAGYAHDIDWIANIQPCVNADDFANEAVWVILNSGMKEQIARNIWHSIRVAWDNGLPTSSAFGHDGKVKAIDYIVKNKENIFAQFEHCLEPLEFLESLPFIGKITKYHLAKNLGFDCIKPDRHLVRIAKTYDLTPDAMCEMIREHTGEKLSMIDMVIWRAANLGMI
jgi:hypothetical protein